jgi:hypothetical protein
MTYLRRAQLSVLLVSSVSLPAAAQTHDLVGAAQSNDYVGHAVASGDFDCDGRDDLVIGVPGEAGGGAINIVYADGRQYQHGAGSFYASPLDGDSFGMSLAAGDFDDDGCDDLAIGAPGKAAAGRFGANQPQAGIVVVAYGMRGANIPALHDGLQPSTATRWGVKELNFSFSEADAGFGYRLASGDFDNDGADDLVVGVPYSDYADKPDAGMIAAFYGQPDVGIQASFAEFFTLASSLEGDVQAEARFGYSLAVGDFDNNGDDDVAVGSPGDEIGGHSETGSVNVLYSNDGLTDDDDRFHFAASGVPGNPGFRYRLGEAVAAGDFNADQFDDLAIGSPTYEGVSDDTEGAVIVLYSAGSAGLRATSSDFIRPGVGGVPANEGQFGSALAAGDFNRDSKSDLAIGAPWIQNGVSSAIHVVYGTSGGITTTGNQYFGQDSPGVPDAGELFDRFGGQLAVGDMDDDGTRDLIVGVPYESQSGFANAGIVQVFFGEFGQKLDYSRNKLYRE